MNPALIAISNIYTVLTVASVLFVVRIGLTLFGQSRLSMFVDMFALAGLALMVISALGGFMGAAESISNGVWPK